MTELAFTPETRMLVDGELIHADSGKTFDNVNPATEEVLGQRADASPAEMQRAIAAARRAFDETDWSTNRALRRRCLEQLHEALVGEAEQLREELIAEVGSPRTVTYMAQLDGPLADALSWPARLIDEFEWERDMGQATMFGIDVEPGCVEGADRCGRRHHAVELSVRGHDQQGRPDPRDRQHDGAQARAGHAVERHPARAPRRREDRHPAWRVQRRDVVRSPRRRGADVVTGGRHDLVHRFDRHRQADHGEGRRHAQAGVPRARGQVGEHRARRCRLPGCGADGLDGVHARRSGLCDADRGCCCPGRATRRASS